MFFSSSSRYLIFLLWLFYLFISAILLFTNGYLQDRYLLNSKATCTILDNCVLTNGRKSELLQNGYARQYCTKKKKIKGIMIVIDALRYDFIKFVDNISEYENFHNHMSIVNEVSSNHSRLYKFIAHPPTTTYQRLHGLTTGSLPTFVDIGNNFGSTNVKEDNLIDQLKSNGYKVVFIGDDTWTGIYPDGFYRKYVFPSFNVWNLDSVDNNIKDLIYPEMKKKDWDVIIAHFLGVDHCGHSLGPKHPEMARKLSEMNEVIAKVIDEMDDSTILFVFGDHGMTNNGEHAGDSMEETATALFVFSKDLQVMSGFLKEEEIYQVDFVPTIANIFSIPIPYSNLGSTLLGEFDNDSKCPLLDLWSNVNQVTQYIKEYSSTKSSQFSEEDITYLLNTYEQLKKQFGSRFFNEELFFNNAREYMKDVREMCQKVWTQFDLNYMSIGMLLLFLVLAVGLKIIGMKRKYFESILKGIALRLVFIVLFSTFLTLLLLYQFNFVSIINITYIGLTCSFSVGILFWMVIPNSHFPTPNRYTDLILKYMNPISASLTTVILVFCVGSLSNSYIVEESSLVAFLLMSILWMAYYNMKPVDICVKKIGKKETSFKMLLFSLRGKVLVLIIIVSILIRTSFMFWRCRDEQEHCEMKKDLPKPDVCVVSVFVLSLYITFIKSVLLYNENLYGSSFVVLLARYCPFLCVVCCGCYWINASLPPDIKFTIFSLSQIHLFSEVAFFTSLFSIIFIYFRPLFICLRSECKFENYNPIASLRSWLGLGSFHSNYSATLSGLATVYSATFMNISSFALIVLSILLGGHRALNVILMFTTCLFLAVILALLKSDKAKNTSPSSIAWLSAVCWGLSSSVFFFGTGHQTAFSTIQWESAGIFGDITTTFFPGVLVVLNTFASQVFHALFLPVLFIMPYSVSNIFSSLSSGCSESRRTEMDMYHEKAPRIHGMFSFILRYVLFLGFRVFMSMVCAFVHMRHIVTWNVFAPKLIFELVSFLITLPFLLLGFLFVERISSQLEKRLKY